MGCYEENAWLGWSSVTQDWLTLLDFRIDRTEFGCEDRLKDLARVESFGVIEELIEVEKLKVCAQHKAYSEPPRSLRAAADLIPLT